MIENHIVSSNVFNQNPSINSSSFHMKKSQEIYLTSKKCDNFETSKAQEKQMCPSIDLKAGILNFTDIQLNQIEVITMVVTGTEGQIHLWGINEYQNTTLYFLSTTQQEMGMYFGIKYKSLSH